MHPIKEWPVVETIVVRTVRLGVVRRRQDCHLVPVDRVATEEVFHFLGHLGSYRLGLVVL